MKSRLLYLTLFFASTSLLAISQDGSLDSSFNTFDNGYWGNGSGGNTTDIVFQPDGKILMSILGRLSGYDSQYIGRTNADGSPDTTFKCGIPTFSGYGKKVKLLSNGQMIVLVNKFLGSSNHQGLVYRLNSDGSVDNTFSINNIFDGYVNDLVIQSDDKIIVVGEFDNCNGVTAEKIIRLNSDGTIDPTFTSSGTNGIINSVGLDSNENVIVAGDFNIINGGYFNKICRLDTIGTPDLTFDNGSANNYAITDFSILSNGKIVIVGHFTTYNGILKNGICRLNVDGTLDNTFVGGNHFGSGVIGFEYPKCIIELENGKFFVGGAISEYNGNTITGGVRITSNGDFDLAYQFIGSSDIIAATERADAKIISGSTRTALLNTDGSIDTSFNKRTGIFISDGGSYDGVYEVKVLENGKIFVGGFFSFFNNDSIRSAVRLLPDGSRDYSFIGDSLFGRVNTVAEETNGKIILGGSFSIFENGTSQFYGITRLLLDGTIDPNFINGGFSDLVNKIVLQPDGKILVGGRYTAYGGSPVSKICRLNSDGTLDTTFQASINETVHDIVLLSNGTIYVGGEIGFGGFLHRLNSDGTFDNTFNTAVDEDVRNLQLLPDGRLLVHQNGANVYEERIVRIHSDGSIDSSFQLNMACSNFTYTSLTDMQLLNNGKLLVSSAVYINNSCFHVLSRWNEDGELDNSFSFGIEPIYAQSAAPKINSIDVQDDGLVIIGGNRFRFGEYSYKNGVARIDNTDSLTTAGQEIKDQQQRNLIVPNPAKDEISILPSSEFLDAEVQILGINGEVLHADFTYEPSRIRVDISELQSGIYLIRLVNNKRVDTIKFIKL